MTRRGDSIRREIQSVETAIALSPIDASYMSPSANMAEDLTRHRQELVAELMQAEVGQLDVVFTGEQVHEHSVEVDLLVETLGPFQSAVASVGQLIEDEATAGGVIPTEIRRMTSMRLEGTFDGSFGLRLGGPEPEVQLTLMPQDDSSRLDQIGSVFERSVSRVLDVLNAANADDWEQQIIENVSTLGSRALSHLESLSKGLSRSQNITRFTWRPPEDDARVVTINSESAVHMRSVLSNLESTERDVPVVGELLALDLLARSFAIMGEDGETVYRGRAPVELFEQLEELFHQSISVILTATVTRSKVSGKESIRYALARIV